MTTIPWPKALPAFYSTLHANCGTILGGTLVTIDPSIGSASSSPGYAMFFEGRLQISGTLYINHRESVYKRTRRLYETVATLLPTPPDVLGIEGLPSSFANVKTIWAVGLSIAAADAMLTLEIPIPFWKAFAKQKAGYAKGDEADAIVMGEALIAYCQEISHVAAS